MAQVGTLDSPSHALLGTEYPRSSASPACGHTLDSQTDEIDMIVLVVGPSGVGKSSTCDLAARHFPQVVFRDLDGLAARYGFEKGIIQEVRASQLFGKIGPERYLEVGLQSINKLTAEFPNKHLVIDVGAGFQVAPNAIKLHLEYPIIAITASLDAAYQRIVQNREDKRSINHDKRDEFSPHRVAVYNSAQHKIDTTDATPEQSGVEFIQVLDSLLMSPSPR